MPFDGLPEGLCSDLVKLRVALDGVRKQWTTGEFGTQGDRGDADHCAVGWLLVATDWDRDEAVRLALQYVYPALPEKQRNPTARLYSIVAYNDNGSKQRIVKLFTDACALAEQRAAR